MSVHRTAIVEPRVHVGRDVVVGPYSHLEEGAVVGEGARLASHTIVRAGAVLGRNVVIDSFAVVGGAPQELASDEHHPGRVAIGMGAVVREGATIHRSTGPGQVTSIGRETLLMANSHVGHDCCVGSHVVLANNVMLGGHVEVGDFAFLAGGVGVHQHVRIGEGAMVAGNASISLDVPPFTLAGGRNVVYGLNTVGLTRRGVAADVITDLRTCLREIFRAAGDPETKARSLLAQRKRPSPELTCFLMFFETTARGFCHTADSPAARRRMSSDGVPTMPQQTTL